MNDCTRNLYMLLIVAGAYVLMTIVPMYFDYKKDMEKLKQKRQNDERNSVG